MYVCAGARCRAFAPPDAAEPSKRQLDQMELAVTPSLKPAVGPARRTDRWVVWPALLSVVAVVSAGVLCRLPGLLGVLLIPIWVLGVPTAGILLAALAIIVAARRRPRTAASIMTAALLPALLLRPVNWAADYAHLALTAWFGMGQIGSNAKPDGSAFQTFDWSVGLSFSGDTILIYDATDEIALPLKLHTRPVASENGFGKECAGRVRHLLGHYYVCEF